MLNYDTEMFGKFIRGNFGVRVVNTDVTSIGFREGFDVVTDPGTGVVSLVPNGTIEETVGGGDYTEVLPSANLVVDYEDNILLRAGIYRGMSRADPSDLGYSRTFETDDADDPESVEDLLVGVNGSGNPDLQPLMSWNYDAAIEWYPSDDSMVALGVYFKQFNGGFQQQTQLETFIVDGEEITLPITNSVTTDEASELNGL